MTIFIFPIFLKQTQCENTNTFWILNVILIACTCFFKFQTILGNANFFLELQTYLEIPYRGLTEWYHRLVGPGPRNFFSFINLLFFSFFRQFICLPFWTLFFFLKPSKKIKYCLNTKITVLSKCLIYGLIIFFIFFSMNLYDQFKVRCQVAWVFDNFYIFRVFLLKNDL